MTRLAVAATLALALALAAVSITVAQGPDVKLSHSDFDCVGLNGGSEVVKVTNFGDAAQNLAGWELRSDPETSEVFDLSALGTILAGGSVSIKSGPSASGAFIWSTSEIFRDNDPTDYVKLVDATGATIDQVNCAAGATATATPTATPTPTPQPSPAAGVPNGGGPPPPSADMLSPGMMVLIGGSLAAVGAGTIALPWLRLRLSAAASPSSRRRRAAGGRVAAPRKRGYSILRLAVVAFTAAMVVRVLRRPRA